MAVPAEVEEDDLGLAGLARRDGLVDGDLDGMRRLGGGQDALGSREGDAGLEGRALVDGPGLDDVVVLEQAHQRRHAVVTQAAGVDGVGHEIVAQGVHLDQRRELAGVAEVVRVDAAGHEGAASGSTAMTR